MKYQGFFHGADSQQSDYVGVIELCQETCLFFKVGAHLIVSFLFQRLDGNYSEGFPFYQLRSFGLFQFINCYSI